MTFLRAGLSMPLTVIAAMAVLTVISGPVHADSAVFPLGTTGWNVAYDPDMFALSFRPDSQLPVNQQTGHDHLEVSFLRNIEEPAGANARQQDTQFGKFANNVGDLILRFTEPEQGDPKFNRADFGLRITLDLFSIRNTTTEPWSGIELAALTGFETAVPDFQAAPGKNLAHPDIAHFHPENTTPNYTFSVDDGFGGQRTFHGVAGDGSTSPLQATMDLQIQGTVEFGTQVAFTGIGLHKPERMNMADDFWIYITPSFFLSHVSALTMAYVLPALQRELIIAGTAKKQGNLNQSIPSADWDLQSAGNNVDQRRFEHHTLDGVFK